MYIGFTTIRFMHRVLWLALIRTHGGMLRMIRVLCGFLVGKFHLMYNNIILWYFKEVNFSLRFPQASTSIKKAIPKIANKLL